jgi:hypothetical protein
MAKKQRYPIDELPDEIGRLPRVLIRDVAPQRRTRIVGKVRLLGEPLAAPLSARPCCAWDARVADGSNAELLREIGKQDFVVEDETGRALVRAETARIIVKRDGSYQSQGRQATSPQEAFLARHGRLPSGELNYREGALTPGETVAVVGTPWHEPDPDPKAGAAFREMPMRLVFGGADLYVTDDEGSVERE